MNSYPTFQSRYGVGDTNSAQPTPVQAQEPPEMQQQAQSPWTAIKQGVPTDDYASLIMGH